MDLSKKLSVQVKTEVPKKEVDRILGIKELISNQALKPQNDFELFFLDLLELERLMMRQFFMWDIPLES